MNAFERKFEEITLEAKRLHKNIPVGITALHNIYANMSNDDKNNHLFINKFLIVLYNLL